MPLQIALYNSRVGVQYKQPSRGYTCYTNSNLVAILVCSLGDAYCAIIIIYSFSMIDCFAFNLTYFKLYMFAGLQTGLKCTDNFLLGRYPLSPFWGILRRCQKSLSNSFPCHRKRTNAGQSYWGGFSVRGNNSFPVIDLQRRRKGYPCERDRDWQWTQMSGPRSERECALVWVSEIANERVGQRRREGEGEGGKEWEKKRGLEAKREHTYADWWWYKCITVCVSGLLCSVRCLDLCHHRTLPKHFPLHQSGKWGRAREKRPVSPTH